MEGNDDVLALEHEISCLANGLGRHVGLLIGLDVHEDVALAVLVRVLHITTVNSGGLHLETGVEGLIDSFAGQDVLDLGTHEGGPLTRLDVLELDHLPQLAFEIEHQAVLQVVRRCHGLIPHCWGTCAKHIEAHMSGC